MRTGVQFVKRHQWSGVVASSPDGCYYWQGDGLAQVIVIGPMVFTPGEMLQAVIDETGDKYEITAIEHMTCADEMGNQMKKLLMQRGFISIRMERDGGK